jgi:hypothetical protein
MMGLKPISAVGEKAANYAKLAGQKFALQSGFNGARLAPAKTDSFFVSANTGKFNSQAERLKEFYNHKGLPYLLPHEEWSDKKIIDTVSLLGKDVDKLVEKQALNKHTLQDAIEKIAPSAKGKVIIKDFGDLENDLSAKGKSENSIKLYLTKSAAMTLAKIDESVLYLKFEELSEGKNKTIILKKSIEHEVKHALSARFQNTRVTDMCKSNIYKCSGQSSVFNNIFNLFQADYHRQIDLSKTEVTQTNMLRSFGCKSAEELHGDFEKSLDRIVKDAKSTGKFKLGSDKRGWKQFFNYLKHGAKDEKEAYQANKRYREVYGDLNTPTFEETTPLLYDEMEKFFAQKRIQVNKQIPNI